MGKGSAALVALALLGASSCGGREKVTHPTFPDGGLLAHATPLPVDALTQLDGMYATSAGADRLGATVAVHATRDTLSLFAAENAAYAVLHAGCLPDSALVLEGYWRFATSVDTGLVRLFVGPPALARSLCTGAPPEGGAIESALEGSTGEDDALPDAPAAFARTAALRDPGRAFIVGSHRGACRTIDDCGASENSVESIRMAESFGANLVELDVQLTADGVPILYHDDNFDPRLTSGVYCHGPVSDFTFAHVRAHCRLLYGEDVPTLDEALAAIVDDTRLTHVWLDVKGAGAVAPVVALTERYSLQARQRGREVELAVGLADADTLGAWESLPRPANTACLAELDPSDVRAAGCRLWGPRWTRGPMLDDVRALQADGHHVVFWTLDDPTYVDFFLNMAQPDGLLSDRPGLVFHRFQSVGQVPSTTGGT